MASKGRKLRVGVVGSGGIAVTQCDYLKKFGDSQIVAACDVNGERLKTFAEKYGITGLYRGWGEMLRKEKLDAVTVCTPNGLHMKPTVDALKAGCHVMVEKPLAMNAVEGSKMVNAARRARRHLVIGFQHRFSGTSQVIRRAFLEGVFGRVLLVRVQALRRRGIPNWGVFGRKELQGGGPLIDIGVHALEMAHYAVGTPEPVTATGNCWTYMGNKPSDVFSTWPRWDHKTYNVEDLAVGHIRMKGGMVIQIESAFATHIEKNVFSYQIFGEKGGATYDPAMLFCDRAGTMLNCTPGFVPKVDVFEYKMRHFVDVCLHGRRSEAPGEHGLMVQKMLDGIYRSAAKGGREVAIR